MTNEESDWIYNFEIGELNYRICIGVDYKKSKENYSFVKTGKVMTPYSLKIYSVDNTLKPKQLFSFLMLRNSNEEYTVHFLQAVYGKGNKIDLVKDNTVNTTAIETWINHITTELMIGFPEVTQSNFPQSAVVKITKMMNSFFDWYQNHRSKQNTLSKYSKLPSI